MSRPGSTLIQPEPEQLYVPLGPPASHYKTPVQTPYSQYNAVQGSPYSPGPGSPTRKFTPPKSQTSNQPYQGHYLSPSSQAIPVTVKSSPVCQADVSHEILRPTPRRPPSSASPPRGPSNTSPAGLLRSSPQLLTIPVSAASKSGSPPSRATPVSRQSPGPNGFNNLTPGLVTRQSPGPPTSSALLSTLNSNGNKPGSLHSNQSSLSSGGSSGRGVTPTAVESVSRLSAASPTKSEPQRIR
jgi:hypothetical protein